MNVEKPPVVKKYVPQHERMYPLILYEFLCKMHLLGETERKKIAQIIIDLSMPDYVEEEYLEKFKQDYDARNKEFSIRELKRE